MSCASVDEPKQGLEELETLLTLVFLLRCRFFGCFVCDELCWDRSHLARSLMFLLYNDGEQLENSVHWSFRFWTTLLTTIYCGAL